jgi:hypothetical protein
MVRTIVSLRLSAFGLFGFDDADRTRPVRAQYGRDRAGAQHHIEITPTMSVAIPIKDQPLCRLTRALQEPEAGRTGVVSQMYAGRSVERPDKPLSASVNLTRCVKCAPR